MWYKKQSFRRLNENYLEYVRKTNVSPFKAEIAQFFRDNLRKPIDRYADEINAFKQLFSKHISGIITTNYDTFLEDIAQDYKVYIGQEELVFSAIQGIAEIYKIHGCVTEPEKIVINHLDYEKFHEKSAYLAAKLMTIFVEYPVIFIGYSLSDPNIRVILQSIVDCLSEDNTKKLQDRFVFVDYSEEPGTLEVHPSTIQFSKGRSIRVTSVILYDYSVLYKVLLSKETALPARVARFYKEEYYSYIKTNTPSRHIMVGAIDDPKIKDDDLVIAIGTYSEVGRIGLYGIKPFDWIKNIVMNHLDYFTADDLLGAFPHINKHYNYKLPINKYVSEASRVPENCQKHAEHWTFEKIIPKTIKDNRHSISMPGRSIEEIKKSNLPARTKLYLMAHLEESAIDIVHLEEYLIEIYTSENAIEGNLRTNLNRMVRILDYLKYKKE